MKSHCWYSWKSTWFAPYPIKNLFCHFHVFCIQWNVEIWHVRTGSCSSKTISFFKRSYVRSNTLDNITFEPSILSPSLNQGSMTTMFSKHEERAARYLRRIEIDNWVHIHIPTLEHVNWDTSFKYFLPITNNPVSISAHMWSCLHLPESLIFWQY